MLRPNVVWCFSISLIAGQHGSEQWDEACRLAMNSNSYCMFYKLGPGSVCHGSNPPILCGPSNISNDPTPGPPSVDECFKVSQSAAWEHLPNDNDKDFMWARMEDANKCLNSLTITNFNALFTLHNLKYGVAEMYAFADVANGLENSIESNKCGFKKHSLNVDIKGFINDKIEEFARVLDEMNHDEQRTFLRKSIPSATFHFSLQREFNRLNDAHTRYSPPFGDFVYVLPILFESSMQGGVQVITLGSIPLLASRHFEVYGEPATLHKDGNIITEVDDKPILEWMKEMVSDKGPYVGIYQGPLQRLNNIFFSKQNMTVDLLRYSPPTSPLKVSFSDGTTEYINWLARLSNYTKSIGKNAISWQFYNAMTNRNPLFQRTVAFETEFYTKRNGSLWELAGETSTEGFNADTLDAILQRSTGENGIEELMEMEVFTPRENGAWNMGNGYQYTLLGDTVIVFIPRFRPSEKFYLPAILYQDFSEVQSFARKHNATRLLFDLSSNGGGDVLATMALLWYIIYDTEDICTPMVRHMTANWVSWLESFGTNFNDTITAFFENNRRLVENPGFIHDRFQQLYHLMNYADQLLTSINTPKSSRIEAHEVARLKLIESSILSERNATLRAAAFKAFLMDRRFLNVSTSFGGGLAPPHGWYLFDNDEWVDRKTKKLFSPPLSQFTNYRSRQWGKASNYSAEGTYGDCYRYMDEMSLWVDPNYKKDYWTEVAFVTNGNCGSACSRFTQALQLTGRATAFTFGGLADQPMDVASFGGGNVYEYDNISPMLNIASHLGYWATFGGSNWSKQHIDTWVNKPVPFPSKARARYTWNINLHDRLGPDALPRQFYRIPPHKHINMWARTLEERAPIHKEIVGYKNWTHLRVNPQFKDLGYCPTYGQ